MRDHEIYCVVQKENSLNICRSFKSDISASRLQTYNAYHGIMLLVLLLFKICL